MTASEAFIPTAPHGPALGSSSGKALARAYERILKADLKATETDSTQFASSVGQLQGFAEADLAEALTSIAAKYEKAFFAIDICYSDYHLPDGGNVNQCVRDPSWWLKKIQSVWPKATELPSFDPSVAFFASWSPAAATRSSLSRANSLIHLRYRLMRSAARRATTIRHWFADMKSAGELLPTLRGKKVSIVGNARSLSERSYGQGIDAADIVIRFNAAPIAHFASHGQRTDWIATGVPITLQTVNLRGAREVIWMTRSREIPGWMFKSPLVCLQPPEWTRTLTEKIGKRPTTGLLMIDMLARSECLSVDIFGFDFFDSLSTSGIRAKDEVPHDFVREKQVVADLISVDGRFRLNS